VAETCRSVKIRHCAVGGNKTIGVVTIVISYESCVKAASIFCGKPKKCFNAKPSLSYINQIYFYC